MSYLVTNLDARPNATYVSSRLGECVCLGVARHERATQDLVMFRRVKTGLHYLASLEEWQREFKSVEIEKVTKQ